RSAQGTAAQGRADGGAYRRAADVRSWHGGRWRAVVDRPPPGLHGSGREAISLAAADQADGLLGEGAAIDLAGAGQWQFRLEEDPPGMLHRRRIRQRELLETSFIRFGAGAQHDKRDRYLAALLVCDRHDARLVHGRVALQQRLDLAGI